MTVQRGEVCLLVGDDALIVANDGKPITRLGVLALCRSDLTEKSEDQADIPDDIPGVTDGDLLAAIADRVVRTYAIDPNRRKGDLRREKGVSADYGGRFLWELIQNADDAMAPDGASTKQLSTPER